MTIELKGLTWDQERGWGPWQTITEAFQQSQPVEMTVKWDRRPLKEIDSMDLAELIENYDLLIVNHSTIGYAAAHKLLLPIGELPNTFVGKSAESYFCDGQYWAFPWDASCHMSAAKGNKNLQGMKWDDLLKDPLVHKMGLPLKGKHAFFVLLTLMATYGSEFNEETGFPARQYLIHNLEVLRKIASKVNEESLTWDAVDAMNALSWGKINAIPLIFGNASFENEGVLFGGIPTHYDEEMSGALLGGKGIGISAKTEHADLALAYARFSANAEVQEHLMHDFGGQPAHVNAWNTLKSLESFYNMTHGTMLGSYLRPRFESYLSFEENCSNAISEWLESVPRNSEVIADQLIGFWNAR